MGTKELIELGFTRFLDLVPALKQLKLVVRLELRTRGDTQTWAVQLPQVTASKRAPRDAMIEVSLARSHFKALAEDGALKHWREAYELGHIKAAGQEQMLKLVANVVEKQEQRARLKKIKSK